MASKKRLLAVLLLLYAPAFSQPLANKSALQAAFTYNFANYTEWPSLAGEVFNICTWRAPMVSAALQELPPRRLKNLPVRYPIISTLSELKNCQVLYVGEDAHSDVPAIHTALNEQPILMVSTEKKGELPPHVSIVLQPQNQRLVFSINRSAAEAAHLKISVELLGLATKVY